MADEIKNTTTEQAEKPDTFTPITSQEQLNGIIKDRIERAKNSVRAEFKDFDSYKQKAEAYDSKVSEMQAQIDELTAASGVKDIEIADLKTQVTKHVNATVKAGLVSEFKLPAGSEEFLTGENEQEWRAKAQKLSAITVQKYPDRSHAEQAQDASLGRSLLNGLFKGE